MSFLKEAIYHVPFGKWSFQVDQNTIELVLRARKGDVEIADVFGGDVYSQQSSWKKYRMTIKYSDNLFDYYFVQIKPKFKRFKYYFQLKSSFGEYISYSEKELFVGMSEENLSKVNNGAGSFVGETTFVFPYINKVDYQGAPEWVNNTIWYQIFPERFARGDNPLEEKVFEKWDSITGEKLSNKFMGGNIRGIIEKLDYIESIGFNGIYLCPIFKAPSIHKYDTEDYMQIDPDFGSEEDFKELIEKAHQKGMRIMIDGVFNHSGGTFSPWLDVLKNKDKSKYKDWFMINDFTNIKNQTWDSMQKDYPFEAFAFVPSMPRINWENKDARNYLLNVVKHWTSMGVDGWRMDVAYEPSHNFWQDVKRVMREINPESYLMGEIWTNAQAWMNGNEFDAVMNYTNQDFIIKYICKKEITLDSFISGIINASYMYPDTIMRGMFNLLDSHDTARIIHFAKGNKQLVKIAQFLLLFQTGSPSIYYGSEYLLEGAGDPDCRRCMKWNEKDRDSEHFALIKTLINMRKKFSEWRRGNIAFEKLSKDAFVVKKTHNKETTIALINLGEEREFNLNKFLSNNKKIILRSKKIGDSSSIGQNEFLIIK